MTLATINRILSMFLVAFRDMSIQVRLRDVERLAVLVHHSMQHGRRVYHTPAHLFDMAKGMNPRQVLAVLFHDIVYYQIDGGFPEKAKYLLDTTVRVDDDQVILLPFASRDSCVALCGGLFDFQAGETLPLFGGMNEFLSAVVATRLLQPYLSTTDLIAIGTCIEATIPFRGPTPTGQTVFERAADRVAKVSQLLNAGLTRDDINRTVTDAVVMANRDVVNFSVPDPGHFLSATWQLIEESNAPLAAVGVYSIQEYRGALMRMEGFLGSINPDHVFHSYQGTPDATEFAALRAATKKNLAFSLSYLGAKIVSMALLEALALETGGDCPVAMMLGEIRSQSGVPNRVENLLPPLTDDRPTDPALLAVFDTGRAKEAAFDLTASPLTAYIYRCEGEEGTVRALKQAKKMFAGERTPRHFLASLRPELVRCVAGACAQIAISRSAELRAMEAAL